MSPIAKNAFRLDHTNHCGVTLLGIFPHHFGDRTNDFLPLRHPIIYPFTFGFVVPNETAQIKRARANLKPVTQTKLFTFCEVIWMHY